MSSKARAWFAAFVVLVFVSGVATGLLLHRSLEFSAFAGAPPRRGGPPPMRGPSPAHLAAMFADELQLTGAQRAQVEQILEARRGRLDAFQDEVRARFEQEHKEINAEIERLLTPEQRDKFEAFQQRMRSRGRGRGRPPGPPF